MSELLQAFQHVPHPRTRARLAGELLRPPRTADERVGFNGRAGLLITNVVGTMWAAYAFTALALISLPAAIASGSTLVIISWIAQTFLQLVLLPIILVGQNIQSRASDRRAEETFKDSEAILHECVQIQQHLAAQDAAQQDQMANLNRLIREMEKRLG